MKDLWCDLLRTIDREPFGGMVPISRLVGDKDQEAVEDALDGMCKHGFITHTSLGGQGNVQGARGLTPEGRRYLAACSQTQKSRRRKIGF